MSRLRAILRFWLLLVLLSSCGCAMLLRVPPARQGDAGGGPLRGVFHLHSEHSHDSKASLGAIRRTARQLDLDFVVITDHNTLEGSRRPAVAGRPLLIFGEEISSPQGHIIALGTGGASPPAHLPSADVLEWIRARGGVSILAHPASGKNPWRGAADAFDALEVYNFSHSLYPANKAWLALSLGLLPPGRFLHTLQRASPDGIGYWDQLLETRPVAALGAADAHIHFHLLGWAPESLLLAMRAVTLYVPGPERSAERIIQALAQGRSYLVFETQGHAAGFVFEAHAGERIHGLGDHVAVDRPVRFEVRTPRPADIRLIHRGRLIARADGRRLSFPADAPGAYRVEVYRRGRPWIIANPIYLQKK